MAEATPGAARYVASIMAASATEANCFASIPTHNVNGCLGVARPSFA